MTDRKMIEQMENDICNACKPRVAKCKGNFPCIMCGIVATELVEKYQPKLPDGAVVLTKEEYNNLLKVNSELAVLEKSIPILTAQVRKETVREILKLTKEKCKELEDKYSHYCKSKKECLEETCRYEGVLAVKRELYELAKQYGGEVDE